VKTSDKSGKIVPSNTNKLSTSNPVGNNIKLKITVNNSTTCELKSIQTVSNPNMHALDYNVIDDMIKMKANISMFDICSIPQQRDLLYAAFNPNNAQK